MAQPGRSEWPKSHSRRTETYGWALFGAVLEQPAASGRFKGSRVQVSLARWLRRYDLARDRMVGLEKVVPVVALFDLSEAVDRLRRERLGHLEALLRVVEVATGVIGLKRSFQGG